MKIALILTTIQVPVVLELYRRHGPDVMFFVAGDRRTPDDEVVRFLERISSHYYFGIDRQHKLGYKCSHLLGENCIQRRNIALLEAIKWGADIIVSIDDDNIPVDRPDGAHLNYFENFQNHLDPQHPFSGLQVSSANHWFDVGQLLDPVAPHRGFPIDVDPTRWRVDPVVGAEVGVAAGICLGDPDISAVTRIANHPTVHRVSQLLEAGIVVNPTTWTVWNSQNTALVRELVPAWGMIPFIQRYDDILASLVCGRVMRERGLHVHFGRSYVWQQRNSHKLIKDLRGEIEGMDITEQFAFVLNETNLQGQSVIADCRRIWDVVSKTCLLPEKSIAAMLAYIDDCEGLGL